MPYRVILICLLMGVYLLTANDRLQSADGYAILATAQSGNINIMGAVDYLLVPQGRMGTFGLDGNLYSKKGITPSLALAPLVWVNHLLPNAPLQATAHLFNGIISTLTALILFGFITRLGYEKRVAFVVSLIFGLGTLYLVYARTLFGEPLAGLLLLMCLWLLHPYSINTPKLDLALSPQRGEGVGGGVKIGILLGLLAGINLTYIIFAPIFALYSLTQNPRRWKSIFLMAGGFIITVGILVGLLNLSRYGSFTETGYKFGAGEGFTTPLLTGLYGLFFSPWRGIFWYIPLFWLLPIGLVFLYRKNLGLALLIVISIAVQAVIYGLWWSWHGGVVWGARFLLPIIPLVMIAFAPLVKYVLYLPRRDMIYHASTNPAHKTGFIPPLRAMRRGLGGGVKKFLFITLTIISIGLQLLGTAYDFNPHEGVLYAVHEDKLANALMYHPELSAINANLTSLKNGESLNWWWVKNNDMLGLLSAIIIMGFGILLFFAPYRLIRVGAIISLCVGMIIFALRGESDADRQKRDELQTALSPSAPIIATTDDTTFINLRGFSDISTIYAPTSPDEPLTRQLWQNATYNGGLRWFVTWFNPANPDNWAEKYLFTNEGFVKEVWAGGYRAVLFYNPPLYPEWIASTWQFGDVVRLNRYAIQVNENGVFVSLDWGLSAPLPADWSWFVHILDGNGQIIAQQDRIPLGGYMPNEPSVIERLYFITPPQNMASVRIGWVQNGALVPIDGVSEGFIIILP